MEYAPEWDGHTPHQAIERIGKLTRHEPEPERTCKNLMAEYYPKSWPDFECSECAFFVGVDVVYKTDSWNYCGKCGAKVINNDN